MNSKRMSKTIRGSDRVKKHRIKIHMDTICYMKYIKVVERSLWNQIVVSSKDPLIQAGT